MIQSLVDVGLYSDVSGKFTQGGLFVGVRWKLSKCKEVTVSRNELTKRHFWTAQALRSYVRQTSNKQYPGSLM